MVRNKILNGASFSKASTNGRIGLHRAAVSDIGAAGVRQRRQERVERTNQLIASIKEKQHEAETRQKRRGVLGARFESATKWLGLGVGLGVVVLLCAGVRYFHAAA